jgi:pimeloyl-ACP methyl ester carboxylesterase
MIHRIGISILKTTWLRQIATKLSYYNKKDFATDQAVKIGSVHCFMNFWDFANLNFLFSGGFITSNKVAQVQQPSYVIWGEQDEVIPVSNAKRFQATLSNCQEVVILPQCGHVPHIEKAAETAQFIDRIVR